MRGEPAAQPLLHLEPGLERGILADRALDPGAGHLVQLAVGEGHQQVVVDPHHAASSIWASAWRPRVSREVSVPIGMSSRSAASR